MEELEAALLRAAPDPPASLIDDLERDERGLVRAVGRVLPDDQAQLLLVVDQFEELFTLGADERTRTEFLEVLSAAVDDPTGRVWAVLTLRADHFDRPLSYPGFADLVRTRTEPVVPLSPAELERAIAAPAETVGVVPELALVAEMVADVNDQPGALPLLQFALTETFERRRDGALTLEAYRDVGGVTGAIARRAERLYGRLNEPGKEAARQLFLRLVSVGEGAEDTRRLVPRAELASLEVDPEAMDAVIEAFGRHRLLSFDRDPDTRGPTVEVAHEALLREWTRLRGWIDASREDVITHRRLAGQAEEWQRSERDPSFLLRGGRLLQIEAWTETTGLALATAERGYVAESVRARQVEQAAEEQRVARERVLERRSVRRLRAVVAVLTAAALVAAGLTVIALGQRSDAQRQARLATARELAAAASANLAVDPQRSVLLALQAIDATREDGAAIPEAVDALHAALAEHREILTLQDPSTANVAWSPNGLLLATGGTAGGLVQSDVLLWDARTGVLLHRLKGHTADVANLAFSADSAKLVTMADDHQVIVWNTATGEILWKRPLEGSGGASFSPDGSVIAVATLGPTHGLMRILDAATGDELVRWESGGAAQNPSFSPDGMRLAAGNGGLQVWDRQTGRRVLDANTPYGCFVAAFSPSGDRIACVADHVTILDASTGKEELTFLAHSEVFGSAWSRDGTMFATGSPDGTAKIWNSFTGELLLTLRGHAGLVALVAFSPDDTRLLTGGGDGTARVWDIRSAATAESIGVAGPGSMSSVAYSPDGAQMVSNGYGDGKAFSWLRDASTGAAVRGFPTAWNDGVFGPDGSGLLLAGEDLEIVDPSTGERTVTLCGNPDCGFSPRGTSWSAGGSRIAAGTQGGPDEAKAVVWEAASGRKVGAFGGPLLPGDAMIDVALSPDGALVAGINGRAILRMWNVDSGKQVFRISTGPSSGIGAAVDFSPDGTAVATAGGNGAAIWRVPSGKRVAAFTATGKADSVAFSADGTMLAAGFDDGVTRIWDVATERQITALPGHTLPVTDVAFDPDGSALATTSFDGMLRVYSLLLGDLERLARSRLTRGLTPAECRQYLHALRCPLSARGPAPSPTSTVGPTAPEPVGPEGAYWAVITSADLSDARGTVGTFTLSLSDGRWRLHQQHPDGGTWDGSGSYSVDGSRLTLTYGSDSECFGERFSADWALEYATLTLTNLSEGGPCSDDPSFLAIVQAQFTTHPWAPAL
jgi:WD40 repeat protein